MCSTYRICFQSVPQRRLNGVHPPKQVLVLRFKVILGFVCLFYLGLQCIDLFVMLLLDTFQALSQLGDLEPQCIPLLCYSI